MKNNKSNQKEIKNNNDNSPVLWKKKTKIEKIYSHIFFIYSMIGGLFLIIMGIFFWRLLFYTFEFLLFINILLDIMLVLGIIEVFLDKKAKRRYQNENEKD